MISPRIVKALAALGEDVAPVRDLPGWPLDDAELLDLIGSGGWAFVTADRRILTRPYEAAALRRAHLIAFFLNPFFLKSRFWDQAVWLIRHWPKLKATAETMVPPNGFVVQQNGKMSPLKV